MTDNCIWKRPAAGFLAAGLLFGLLILPCGCRPSPAFACPAFENTVVPLTPVTETEGPEDSQPVLLYEQQDLPDDGEPEAMPSETNVPEIQEEPAETDESLNISSETVVENTENSEPVQVEPNQEAPADEPEEEEKEEEPETVSGAEVTEDTPAEDPAPSPPAAVTDGVIRAGDSGVSPYYVQMAADAYQQAPQWVRTLFENAGWHICLRSGSCFGAAYGYSTSLLGLTVYGEENIYLSAQEAACNRHIICHELGHFIDCLFGWPSSTAEFAGIYNAEYSAFCSYFGYSNGYPSVNELFAEALYHDWTDPGNLRQAAPGTYAYIRNTIG